MVVITVVVVVLTLLSIVAMIGVVACIKPSGDAALEGVMSGCGGVDVGELAMRWWLLSGI